MAGEAELRLVGLLLLLIIVGGLISIALAWFIPSWVSAITLIWSIIGVLTIAACGVGAAMLLFGWGMD
jgi:hypothetical protein